jgi:hypothetical protein
MVARKPALYNELLGLSGCSHTPPPDNTALTHRQLCPTGRMSFTQ